MHSIHVEMAESQTSVTDFIALVGKDGGPANYNKWSSQYDADMNTINYAGYKSVNSKWLSYHTNLDSGVKHRVFDAGCGTGLLGEHLNTQVPRDLIEIHGGDVTPGMLEIAKTKNAYADLRIVNLKAELPYEAESFDSVLSAGVFTWGHCGPDCLPNLIRVLKKGCYLIATVNGTYYKETKLEWERHAQDCNCELLEDNEVPYVDSATGVVLVVHKL